MRTTVRVFGVEPGKPGGRRWRVLLREDPGQFVDYLPTTPTQVVEADTVILAAGAVGSPAVLLSSKQSLPGGLSKQAGRNLSRGGDMLIPVVLPEEFDLDDLETGPGKIIGSCSFHHLFEPPPGFGDDWQRFIIQPMMILPVISALLVAERDGFAKDGGDMRGWGLGAKHHMQKWGSRMLHLGIMGVDGMDGRVTASNGIPTVTFGMSAKTQALFDAAHAGVRNIIETHNGGTMLPSWDEMRGDVLALHPLGSARMGDSPEVGAVDPMCRVFKADGGVHEGLYVMDASVMSSPIGVNTSLTTAALAERAMHLMLAG
jgi:hypothetical protein